MSATPNGDIIRSYLATVCPACGNEKTRKHALCRACFMRLPQAQRASLYAPIGAGFSDAVRRAFETLGVKSPVIPPPTKPSDRQTESQAQT